MDLRQCRRKLGKDTLPTTEPAYNKWFSQVNASTAHFLNATFELSLELPVPGDQRIRLGEEVLKRLADATATEQDGLGTEEIKTMTAWTHFRLAKVCTEKKERAQALQHVRSALEARLAGLMPQLCRDDTTLMPGMMMRTS